MSHLYQYGSPVKQSTRHTRTKEFQNTPSASQKQNQALLAPTIPINLQDLGEPALHLPDNLRIQHPSLQARQIIPQQPTAQLRHVAGEHLAARQIQILKTIVLRVTALRVQPSDTQPQLVLGHAVAPALVQHTAQVEHRAVREEETLHVLAVHEAIDVDRADGRWYEGGRQVGLVVGRAVGRLRMRGRW